MSTRPDRRTGAEPPASAGRSDRYLNRELSWLAFNDRVLAEAGNPNYPLLERLRFLAISAANLDEFMMIRAAGLVGQVQRGIARVSIDGRTPAQQLAEVRALVDDLTDRQQGVWRVLRRQLADSGIHIADEQRVTEEAYHWLRTYFVDEIIPVLTPQAIDPAHPFPFVANRGMGLLFNLTRQSDGVRVIEMVLIPAALKRYVRVPGREAIYVSIEALISRFADHMFPGFTITGGGAFRVLRDGGIELA